MEQFTAGVWDGMRRTYIIAEVGVNHNGQMSLAMELVAAAHAAGADAVKFQTFKAEHVVTRSARMASYQIDNIGRGFSQYEMLKNLELSYGDFKKIQSYAESLGIDFLSTADDEESLDFLVDELRLPFLKVGSGDVTNLPFLHRIASKRKPLILSTGMATLDEVERAVRIVREVHSEKLILLHCTSNYPCPPDEVNLSAMLTMKRAFSCPVGYSDHTLGTAVPVAAVALGAEVIEKHITLNVNMAGPDHKASLKPDDFAVMVLQIREVETALGDGVKRPTLSEQRIMELVRRRIVARKDLRAGDVIELDDLCFKRADRGIYADQVESVIGKRVMRSLRSDQPICSEFLEKI